MGSYAKNKPSKSSINRTENTDFDTSTLAIQHKISADYCFAWIVPIFETITSNSSLETAALFLAFVR